MVWNLQNQGSTHCSHSAGDLWVLQNCRCKFFLLYEKTEISHSLSSSWFRVLSSQETDQDHEENKYKSEKNEKSNQWAFDSNHQTVSIDDDDSVIS